MNLIYSFLCIVCVRCFEGPVLIYSSNLICYQSQGKQKSPSSRDPLCDRRETKLPLISTIASSTISVVIFHSRHKYIFVQLDCENRPLWAAPRRKR